LIIGLTGRNASGKTTAGRWFVEARGFGMDSLSDAIRYWLQERGQPISREALIEGGRTLRREGGPGVLAERLLARIPEGANHVIDSIRTPGEVAALRARPDFILLAIDAPAEARFERLLARGRAGDAETYAAFRTQEEAELISADAAGQALVATAALADHHIDNGGSQDALYAALASLTSLLSRRS